jgi:hypothetical protein
LYGKPVTNKEILSGGVTSPAAASTLIAALNRYSPREEKDKPIESRGDSDRKKQ